MVHVNVGTGQHHQQAHQRRARPRAADPRGRPHAVHREGRFGSRSRSIHWAQEMFDQAGMLRELVKWDYELRSPGPGRRRGRARLGDDDDVAARPGLSRAAARAAVGAGVRDAAPSTPRQLPAPAHPDPQAIVTLAEWIAKAERRSSSPRRTAIRARSRRSAKLAERFALPVVNHNPRAVTCRQPSDACRLRSRPAGRRRPISSSMLECDVPWYPHVEQAAAGCHIAHIGEDPIFQRYPMRSFPSDLSITSRSASACRGAARSA